jgi:hypothetical protein
VKVSRWNKDARNRRRKKNRQTLVLTFQKVSTVIINCFTKLKFLAEEMKERVKMERKRDKLFPRPKLSELKSLKAKRKEGPNPNSEERKAIVKHRKEVLDKRSPRGS